MNYPSDRSMTALVVAFAITMILLFSSVSSAQGPTNWNGMDLGQGCAEQVILSAARQGDEKMLEETSDWSVGQGIRMGICLATMSAYYELGNVFGDRMVGWSCVPEEVNMLEMYNSVAQWTKENLADAIMMTPMGAWSVAMYDIYCEPEGAIEPEGKIKIGGPVSLDQWYHGGDDK